MSNLPTIINFKHIKVGLAWHFCDGLLGNLTIIFGYSSFSFLVHVLEKLLGNSMCYILYVFRYVVLCFLILVVYCMCFSLLIAYF